MERHDASSDLCPRIESKPFAARFREAIGIALLAAPMGCATAQAQAPDMPNYPVATIQIPDSQEAPKALLDTPEKEESKQVTEEVVTEPGCSTHEKLPADQVSFLHARNYSHGLAVVRDRKGFMYIDLSGNPISDDRFDYAKDFDGKTALVGKDMDLYYVDGQGKRVADKVYEPKDEESNTFLGRFDNVGEFNDGMAEASLGSDRFFIDEEGRIQFKTRSDWSYTHYSEGLMPIIRKYDKRSTYVDRQGQFTYAGSYDIAGDFHEGLAAVSDRDDWYHIRSDLSSAYRQYFEYAGDFNGGMAPVKDSEAWYYIQPNGTAANEFTYDRANSYAEDMAVVEKDGRIFHVGRSGKPYPNREICTD